MQNEVEEPNVPYGQIGKWDRLDRSKWELAYCYDLRKLKFPVIKRVMHSIQM